MEKSYSWQELAKKMQKLHEREQEYAQKIIRAWIRIQDKRIKDKLKEQE